MSTQSQTVKAVLETGEPAFLQAWIAESFAAGVARNDARGGSRLKDARAMLAALREGVQAGGEPAAFEAAPWNGLRSVLAQLSASRAASGESVGETSRFVL